MILNNSTDDDIVGEFNVVNDSLYYEVNEFNDVVSKDGLLVLHQNIRSFNKNFDEFSVFLGELRRNVDVIVLTETWFSQECCSGISGYTDFHTYRPQRDGGGVSVYVREGLKSTARPDFSYVNDQMETCVVEIMPDKNQPKQTLTVFAVYRPPDSSVNLFTEKLHNISLNFLNCTTLFSGDLNIDTLDEQNGGDFINLMYSCSFFPLINVPTRVTETTSTCIDNFWYNEFNMSISGVFPTSITDHYSIFTILRFSLCNAPVRVTFRDHSCCSVEALARNMPSFVYE